MWVGAGCPGAGAGARDPCTRTSSSPAPPPDTRGGGVSGGALWELHVELDKDLAVVKVSKKLHGVAFRQSGDQKRVTANAASLIAAFVKDKILTTWTEASAEQPETKSG